MSGVWGVQCLDWCWGALESMFSCLGSNNDETTMKSDQHCELYDSVNHLKVERILLFRVVFEITFSECHCLCVCFGVC